MCASSTREVRHEANTNEGVQGDHGSAPHAHSSHSRHGRSDAPDAITTRSANTHSLADLLHGIHNAMHKNACHRATAKEHTWCGFVSLLQRCLADKVNGAQFERHGGHCGTESRRKSTHPSHQASEVSTRRRSCVGHLCLEDADRIGDCVAATRRKRRTTQAEQWSTAALFVSGSEPEEIDVACAADGSCGNHLGARGSVACEERCDALLLKEGAYT